MAAAPEMMCFVKVDPTFQVVMNAIAELRREGRLQTVCTVTVGNDGLRSAANNSEFGGRYGFARTLGSALRAFMLRSTYLEGHHDPSFQGKVPNLRHAAAYRHVVDVEPAEDHLKLVQNNDQAKAKAHAISANFDRLYPHFFIQNELAAVDQKTWVNLRAMMVIVEHLGGEIVKLHTINTTVSARHMGPAGPGQPGERGPRKHVFECPNPKVVRVTAKVLDLQDRKFPIFATLKVVVTVNVMPDRDIETEFKKLQIGDETEDKNVSKISDDPQPTEESDQDDPQPEEEVWYSHMLQDFGIHDAAAPQPGEQAAPDAAQPEEG